MLKFYTPKEWYALFDCPSLIIDDEGKIWSADNYYKVLFGEPSGRVDYAGGKIYGKDLGYGMMAAPIAYLETKNGVTRVMDAKKGIASAPILYIQNAKVYTPEQWTSLFDAPGGHIRKEAPAKKAVSGGVSITGELGLLLGIALFLLLGSGVEAMIRKPVWLALFAVIAVTALILRKVAGGPEIVRLKLADLSKDMEPAKVSRCKCSAAICAGVLFGVLVFTVILCFLRIYGGSLAMAAFPLKLMLLVVMGGCYWLFYLVFRNAMLLGKLRCWPLK